jgi:hypothetical protein
MFVRFRQTKTRLQASLVETTWNGGKVRSEHVASLGSVPLSLAPGDRITFWTKLHQRLDALSNRVDAGQRGSILAAIHARIPMPTQDDQRAVQLAYAREDARLWQSMAEMAADDIEAHKGLLTLTQRAIAKREAASADFGSQAQAAKDCLAAVEKGEVVAGVPAPMTRKDFLRISGMAEAEAQDSVRLAQVADAMGGDKFIEMLVRDSTEAKDRWRRRTVRKLHAALGLGTP